MKLYKRVYNKRLIYSIELFAVIVGGLLYVSYYNIKRADIRESWVISAHEVLIHTGRIQLLATESEIQARNFMLTNNPHFITQFNRSHLETLKELELVRSFDAGNVVILPILDSASAYLHKRFEFSKQIIRLRKTQGLQAAIQLVQSDERTNYVSKAVHYITLIERMEQSVLARRKADSHKALTVMNISLLITSCFILGVIIFLIKRAGEDAWERKQMMEELIGNDERMKEAEKLASFGAWNVNLKDWTFNGSDEVKHICGFDPQGKEISLANFIHKVHPEDLAIVKSKIENLKDLNGTDSYTFRIIDNDQVKYISNGVIANRGQDNQVLSITGYLQDTTEAIMATEALQQSRANLQTIFDHTDISYVLVNDKLDIISFNKPAQRYATQQNNMHLEAGQPVMNYFLPSRQSEIMATLDRVKKGEKVRYEYSLPQKDGSMKWFETRWINVTDSDNRHRGFIIAIKNITDKKLATIEREKIIADLILRNKALEQFSYIVSHNLRAPVANIVGLGEVLDLLPADSPERQEIVDNVTKAATDLDHIVLDLNTILEVREQVNEKKEVVYFDTLVEEVKDGLRSLPGTKNLQIDCDFSGANQLFTIRNYLYSIFYNLFTNSIKYRRDGLAPLIRVKTSRADNYVELLITDNGKGIDLEKHGSLIFGLYRRFDTTAEGRGVGLFMVRTQVESLGGTINVQSELHHGTEFRIVLPYTEAREIDRPEEENVLLSL